MGILKEKSKQSWSLKYSRLKMRLSALARSGQEFGALKRAVGRRGVTQYQLSQYELLSYPLFWKKVVNTAWRIKGVWKWPIGIGYAFFTLNWVQAEADRQNRKVDGMYDHET